MFVEEPGSESPVPGLAVNIPSQQAAPFLSPGASGSSGWGGHVRYPLLIESYIFCFSFLFVLVWQSWALPWEFRPPIPHH